MAERSAHDHALDAARFADADHVLHGPDGARLVAKVLYAVYLTAFLALTYAFTILRAVLVSSDTAWVRDNLGDWRGVALSSVAAVLLLWGAWWLGGRRGPATPPLPWIDHVVAAGLDRAVTVRPWWRSALLGVGGCAGVLGGVVGGAVYAAGLAGGAAVAVGVVAGALVATVACWVWLAGQSAASRRAGEVRVLGEGALLRSLGLDELRGHARRGQRLHGAVLAGDPRAARLEVAGAIRRGRGLRLRPGGPLVTIVRRDWIGLRRQPGVAGAGALLAAAGAALTAETVLDPAAPLPLTAVGIILAGLAVGQWAQGLRFASDGLSASPVFGGSPTRRAVGHSVVPAAGHVLVAVPVSVLAWAWTAHATLTTLGVLLAIQVALVPLLVGGQWWSAFRVSHSASAFVPEFGPVLLVLSVLRPWLVVVGAGSAALQRLPSLPSPWLGVAFLLLAGSGVAWRGLSLARQLVAEGR